jgi:UDP-glucose 4-epimerase
MLIAWLTDNVGVLPTLLRNASVLVTGASGFIGGRVIRRLAGNCKRLVAFARGAATVLHPHLRGVNLVLGDVCIPGQIEAALGDIDVVIHLAGHSGAQSSAQDPIYDLQTNAGGMIALLEAVRRRGGPCRIVFPGSRLEYGPADSVPVSENAPIRPSSPYGVNKYACELYLDLYARLYGISYAVARFSNPYGPWVAPPAREYNVLNKMIAAAQADHDLTVYGDGRQLRDYLYVDDAVDALLLLASVEENVVVNVGSGRGIAFRDAAETIVRVVGRGRVVSVPWPPGAARLETGDFIADTTNIRALGWEPRTSFEEGIRLTVQR